MGAGGQVDGSGIEVGKFVRIVAVQGVIDGHAGPVVIDRDGLRDLIGAGRRRELRHLKLAGDHIVTGVNVAGANTGVASYHLDRGGRAHSDGAGVKQGRIVDGVRAVGGVVNGRVGWHGLQAEGDHDRSGIGAGHGIKDSSVYKGDDFGAGAHIVEISVDGAGQPIRIVCSEGDPGGAGERDFQAGRIDQSGRIGGARDTAVQSVVQSSAGRQEGEPQNFHGHGLSQFHGVKLPVR